MTGRLVLGAATVLALAGCSTQAAPMPEPAIPVHGETPGYTCRNSNLNQFAGRQATSQLGSEMLRVSGARRLRWVQPGMMVTMEFSAERLTVHLDASGRVERAICG